MCDPIAIASFALSTASTVTQYQAASAEADAQNNYYQQNKNAAIKSQIEQSIQLLTRAQQEDEGRAAEKTEIAQQAQADRATALMSAGENGISGFSVSGLLSEFYQKQGNANAQIDAESGMARQQLAADLRGVKAQSEDRINSVRKATKPSAFAAALQITGAGVDSYGQYKRDKAAGVWGQPAGVTRPRPNPLYIQQPKVMG